MTYDDRDEIIRLVNEIEPNNVELIVKKAAEKIGIDQKVVKKLIFKMVDEGQVSLYNPEKYHSFNNYLTDIESLWFYMVIVSIILFNGITIVSRTFPELMFFRFIVGGIFSFYIPGYVLVKALYGDSQNESVEKVATSITLSLVITPVTGFALNFSPWGITLASMSVSLSLLSVAIAFIAAYRQYTFTSNQAAIQ